MTKPWLVALLAVPCLAAAGGSAMSGGAPSPSPGHASAGSITVTGAYVGDTGSSAYRPVYLTIANDRATPDELEAVIAPAAASATWVVAHKVHTPDEMAAFLEPCGSTPSLLVQSSAALASGGDLLLPAHGQVRLRPGVARIQLNGVGALRQTSLVTMTLYFASGTAVHLSVPVDRGRETDTLP